jgi:acetoin utilization deacetylase AcuC-like enzyme
VKAFWDPVQQRHAPKFFLQRGQQRPNFEVPARAEALLQACHALRLEIVTPAEVDRAVLETMHTAPYLDFLRDISTTWANRTDFGPEAVANIHPTPEMFGNGARLPTNIVGQVGWYTADTSCPIGPHTYLAAVAAAACALAAADEAAAGRHAYALCRPPGHHAYAARAGGHCYINNAALAAQRLRDKGAARVAVLDIDAHHGNGTQSAFWSRADVLYVSIHGDPNFYYPWYVGHAQERGGGRGFGCNLNLPLSRGADDTDWLAALDHGMAAIRSFGADALVLSLGFDASIYEPLQFFAVSADGFSRAGEMVAGGRLKTAIVQEGGYATEQIGGLLERFLAAF